MAALFFIIFLLFLVNTFTRAAKMQQEAAKKKVDAIVEIVARNCPPHKWRFIEVKDQDGNIIRTNLVCDLCGPYKA